LNLVQKIINILSLRNQNDTEKYNNEEEKSIHDSAVTKQRMPEENKLPTMQDVDYGDSIDDANESIAHTSFSA
jgi:hypothetical protein